MKLLDNIIRWAAQREMEPKDVGYYKKKNGDVEIYDKRSFTKSKGRIGFKK